MQPCEGFGAKLPRRLAVGRQCCTMYGVHTMECCPRPRNRLSSTVSSCSHRRRASSPGAINGLCEMESRGCSGCQGPVKMQGHAESKIAADEGSRGSCRLAWPFLVWPVQGDRAHCIMGVGTFQTKQVFCTDYSSPHHAFSPFASRWG